MIVGVSDSGLSPPHSAARSIACFFPRQLPRERSTRRCGRGGDVATENALAGILARIPRLERVSIMTISSTGGIRFWRCRCLAHRDVAGRSLLVSVFEYPTVGELAMAIEEKLSIRSNLRDEEVVTRNESCKNQ